MKPNSDMKIYYLSVHFLVDAQVTCPRFVDVLAGAVTTYRFSTVSALVRVMLGNEWVLPVVFVYSF